MSKIFRKELFLLGAIIILDLFVFNYRSIISMFWKETTFNIEDLCETKDVNGERGIIRYKNGIAVIDIKNINQTVSSIYLDLNYIDEDDLEIDNSEIKVDIYATDEGHALMYFGGSHYIYSPDDDSKYCQIDMYGNTKSIRMIIPSKDNTKGIAIKKIKMNASEPMRLSWIRIFTLVLLIHFVYFFVIKNEYDFITYGTFSQKWFVRLLLIIVPLITILWFVNIYPDTGNEEQYNQLLESFMNGKTYLDEDPPSLLINLDNPYDMSYRDLIVEGGGQEYKWDVAYYAEKYYVYFGVLPVLLIYLPWRFLFGEQITIAYAISIIYLFFIPAVYCFVTSIFNRWHKTVSDLHFILCYLFMVVGTGYLYAINGAQFYSIPILLSGALVLAGLALFILPDKKYRGVRYAFGSLFIALTAACRPQFLVAIVLILILVVPEMLRDRNHRSKVEMAAQIIIPFLVVAVGVMVYNYNRFNSIFDFGANYNLTTNDMTHRGVHINRVLPGVFYYLFILPDWRLVFPFIQDNLFVSSYIGETTYEGMTGGYLSNHLFAYLNLGIVHAKKYFKDKQEYLLAWAGLVSAILIVMVDTQMAGILSRYIMDFGWLLGMSAMMIYLNIQESTSVNTSVKKILNNLLALTVIYSCFYEFCLLFVKWTHGVFYKVPEMTELFYKVKSVIQFW